MPNRPDNAPTDLSRKHPEIWLVYEATRGQPFVRPDRTNPMDWSRVTQGIDGFVNKATIRVALRDEDLEKAGGVGVRHIGDIIGQGGILHPDLRVRIFQPDAPDDPPAAWLFEGYPMLSTASWTESLQSIDVTCISVAHERLRHGDDSRGRPRFATIGRRMLTDPQAKWRSKQYEKQTITIPPLPVHFNAGGRPNRSATSELYDGPVRFKAPTTHRLYTFTHDNAPGAEFWSYVDALRYLLWWHIIVPGIEFDVSSFMADTLPLVGKTPKKAGKNQFEKLILQRVEDERVDAMPVEDAIRQLVTRAGLHYALSIKVDENGGPDGDPIHYLRVIAVLADGDIKPAVFHMDWPTLHDIPREAPFTPLDLGGRNVHTAMKANAAQQATLTIDDHIINRPIYLAGVKFYEVTFPLIPGWLPFRLYSGEGYKNYPRLKDVPFTNVLDAIARLTLDGWDQEEFKEEVQVIKDYWDKGDPEKSQPTVDDDGKQIVPWQFDKRHPTFEAVADVGRKWIFPTDDRYVSENFFEYFRNYGLLVGFGKDFMNWDPFAAKGVNRISRSRFGGIADAAARRAGWVARPRPFGSPMSRFPGGAELPAYFEMKIGGDPYVNTDWLLFTPGSAYISSTEESAITVTMNNPMAVSTRKGEYNIGSNWFIWIARQILYLRVTCLIEGDERMFSTLSSKSHLARDRQSVIDLGERFRYRDRGSDLGKGRTTNSILAKLIPPGVIDPAFESIDDQKKFDEYAEANATILARQAVSGDPEIPWIAFDIGSEPLLLGDLFIGVNGVRLTFADPPELVNITYGNSPGAGYRTTLHLSDLRNDPTLLLESGD